MIAKAVFAIGFGLMSIWAMLRKEQLRKTKRGLKHQHLELTADNTVYIVRVALYLEVWSWLVVACIVLMMAATVLFIAEACGY